MKTVVKIAVTGGVASGKSTVCGFFKKKNITVISLDQLARAVVLPGCPALQCIVDHFGAGILQADGALDRKQLRQMMTRLPESRTIIEGCVQPEILNAMRVDIANAEAAGESVVVIEVPLLFELNMESMFDACILVCVDSGEQVKRVMDRDNVTEESARALIGLQMSQEEKCSRAQYIIENTGGIDTMYKSAGDVLKKILEKHDILSKLLDR